MITNSPYAKRLGDEGCSLHCIPNDANFATTCLQVLDILLNTDYDCLTGIECLAVADVVVGGAGYNTVYECAAVGVPLVTLALPRLYDRQDKRASQGYRVQNIENAIALCEDAFKSSPT